MDAGKVLGPYRIIEPLGAGGMGEVFLAEDTRLERRIALKILPPEFGDDPDRRERFEREAKTVAALEHPNIVTIHSVEEIDDVRFLTMEYVRGRTLAAEIGSGGLALERIFDVAVPLAEGLSAAHELGIVHRDLKPANVMITDDGRVKILDFGLAKLRPDMADPAASHLPTEAITEEGRVLGTVAYMSPEQVKGQPVDARSDIFSCGVMLYQMTAGVKPFRGESWADVSSSIIRDAPAPVTELKQELPAHFGRIVHRCLEKRPEHRYQSALDLRNELAGLARELTAGAVSGKEIAAPRRPSPGLAGAAAAGIVAALALVWFWLSAPPGADPATPAASSIRSLAVLPFDNVGEDPDDDVLIAGMQDALITELSKTDLRVIGQSSASRLRDTGLTLGEIAAELAVDGLVEGTVLHAGGNVRVTARLAHGSGDEVVWAESYDRPLTDVLVLTAEVARAIAAEVEIVVTPDQERRLAGAREVDPVAWELYARGMYQVNLFSGPGFAAARQLFEDAVAIDPEFAPAWAGLGMAYGVPASTSGSPDPALVAAAYRALGRAIELDQGLAGARALRGYGLLMFEWNFVEAERELLLALELKPNSAIARHGYADLLTAQGRVQEGAEQARLGKQYDPLSPIANAPVVAHLMLARRFDEAIAEAGAIRQLVPELDRPNSWVGGSLWASGRYVDAVDEFAAIWRNSGRTELADRFADSFAARGEQEAARVAAEFFSASDSADEDAVAVATWYARAGDADLAASWLRRAYDVHISLLPIMVRRAEFDLVRDDPRYLEIMRALGLPA